MLAPFHAPPPPSPHTHTHTHSRKRPDATVSIIQPRFSCVVGATCYGSVITAAVATGCPDLPDGLVGRRGWGGWRGRGGGGSNGLMSLHCGSTNRPVHTVHRLYSVFKTKHLHHSKPKGSVHPLYIWENRIRSRIWSRRRSRSSRRIRSRRKEEVGEWEVEVDKEVEE